MKIKYSKRGLTFSFNETETFKSGVRYRYIIDTKASEVILIPDAEGKYQFSRKGKEQKPLVDLRNNEIKEAVKNAEYMEIEICDDKIIVHIIHTTVNFSGLTNAEIEDIINRSDAITFEISKDDLKSNNTALSEMLHTSGLFSKQTENELSYIFDTVSLFSGAGLLDYPFFKDESFDLKFAIDFDKSACETYRYNIGDHILCMDIRDLDSQLVPDAELIIGGPCCQGYSNANRAGNTKQDIFKRLLVDDYIRIVLDKKPLIFVIENVKQFLTKENGKYLERVMTALSSDYNITYSIINDNDIGGYSTRERMILIGSDKKMDKIIIPDVKVTNKKTCGDALKKVDSEWYHYSDITQASEDTKKKMSFVRPGHNYKDIPSMRDLDRHSNVYRRLDPNQPAVTITNWRKVNLMPPEGNRILSVAEASAIMGLDKNYRFFGSLNDRQQQVGNGVTIAIATFIKNIIKNSLIEFTNKVIPQIIPV